MKKQTAVEWLVDQLKTLEIFVDKESQEKAIEIFDKALAMEKEQIVDAYDNGCAEWTSMEYSDGQHYYNSTYES